MITLTRVKQATSEFIKILRFGKNDVQTAPQVLPHGIDSKPVKDAIAVHAKTVQKGEAVVLGYVAMNFAKTKEGETRIFATDSGGNEVFEMYFKNDGTCEFGGSSDNLARFSEIEKGIQSTDQSINQELIKIQTAIAGVGGAYTPSTISTDISAAKIKEIKCS